MAAWIPLRKTERTQLTFNLAVALDLCLLTLLALWAWRFFLPLEHRVNIELFDETGDLWAALRLPLGSYPPEYGPLYRLWYRLLALFQPEPLLLSYTSYRWVDVLTPLALYWSLRRARVIPGMAFPVHLILTHCA